VVVTGMGLVTPLGVGIGVETVWSQLLASRSGCAGSTTPFDGPCKIGGVVPSWAEDPIGL
jgi:3-oxoacyl-[acyl-carrier-protein] synthase II